MGSPIRLGIVDTDRGLLRVLRHRVESAGWQQHVLASPVPADALVAMRLDALVMDLEVLGPQRWEYLEAVCAELPTLAVLVCTGRSTVAQRVRALRLGADDWINKPCHPEELLARVEAVVRRRRRADRPAADEPVAVGELVIRSDTHQVLAGAAAVDLTRREFELLVALAATEGQVLRREEIYERVWGYAMVHGDRFRAEPVEDASRGDVLGLGSSGARSANPVSGTARLVAGGSSGHFVGLRPTK